MARPTSSPRTAWKGKFLAVEIKSVPLPNGRRTRVEVLRHPGAAAVLPLHRDGKVTLIRQWRPAIETWVHEVCAGKLDPGEDPESCARRELEEEVGLRCARLHALGWIYTTPGFTDEKIHLFAATGLRKVPRRPEDDEVIEVLKVPLHQALRLAADGELPDAKSQVCLFRAWQEVLAGTVTA